MPQSRTNFGHQVADLYQHLYDLVYLRTHALTEILMPDPSIRRKDKAWQVHELLLDIIKELDPGPKAPAFSREWRRHRLMARRYKNGLDPKEVTQEIAVSRRQYYREHDAAIEAIVDILWDRYVVHPSTPHQESETIEEQPPLSHLELLRLEAARAARAERHARLDEAIQSALPLLKARLEQRKLEVKQTLPASLPGVSVEKGLLRQIFLGIMGYLMERASQATVQLTAQAKKSGVRLSLSVQPPEAIQPTSQAEVRERLSAFEEMATLSGIHIRPVYAERLVVGFEMLLPTDRQRTVLVVDDNEDVLEHFQRLLIPHDYRVVTAQTAEQAIDMAVRLLPHLIFLDLMLPGQDGWDLLQILLNRPETNHIPLIICTVLKQKELALSLGATAFLEKPVTEQALFSTLEALGEA
jgi:CheY-like chemotaxis protein